MRNPDPYAVFNFVVEFNGIQMAGFTEVTGIEAHTEFEEFREGGINHYVHKLAKETKYGNLTLKRGLTDATFLWDWYQDVINGVIERKTVSVVLLDARRKEKRRWIFSDAYPVKWSSSDLNGTSNTVAVESVELAHHGMRKQ
ncbi:MAG: phage tail protein [Candidatus Binatia bacterium]